MAFCSSIALRVRQPPALVSVSAIPRRRPTQLARCSLPTPPTLASIQALAAESGYDLRNNGAGPLLNLRLNSAATAAPLAYLTGAILPTGRLHIESYKSLARTAAADGGALLAVSPGMLVFLAALAAASDRGACDVYGLAINDAPDQHRRLVRYLRRFGGERVMVVDDSIGSLSARVIYGGFGTVIRGNVADMLARGAAMLDRGATLRPAGTDGGP